ncbi:PREDICTED: TMV resistance [Prunus dulcis]|uniref:PREDICTED: TMV resistance n=1 Tax=Prunus dulcis TaxID=3755 RepID=A0A5E4GMI0_PRUDU|nr:PREDICTED: TMV resistance [Prunus dulcis]
MCPIFLNGRSEATFINHIVEEILIVVLNRTFWNVAKYPVGIQSHVQVVEMLLDVGGNGRFMVGIWGASGIGKTTIAKAIGNEIAHKFEGSCFLPNVRENSMPQYGGLIQLQETLLQEILGGKKLKIASTDKGISIIHKLLRLKKILLILDDVNQLEQLDNLAGVGWFGEGSRVIITTQDSGLLKCHGIELIYEVQKLFDYQALELFSLNAFGINEPPNDYLELAQRAIDYAQGLPLAITLLGSHLCNKGIHRWQTILDGYEGEPYLGIQKILRKSYDALENSMQQVFLDIACFFKGEDKDYVIQVLRSCKQKVSQDCIEVLVEKAIITIECNRIWMHDLLEKMGKDIVHEECPIELADRSAYDLRAHSEKSGEALVAHNKISRTKRSRGKIKGIMMEFPKPNAITLNATSFSGMDKLEIFINRNAILSGHIKYLPNDLRFLDWGQCQLRSLPSKFYAMHLAVFNMPCGSMRKLQKFKYMPKLKSLNLSGCQFLKKIPDLSGIPNIKWLNLSNCTSLVEVEDSVGLLDKLVELNLDGCVKLTRFATTLRLKSLERLCLRNCGRLESFPEIEDKLESLVILNIGESGIRGLPSSVAYLTGITFMSAGYCDNLTFTSLCSIYGLQRLTTFGDKVNSDPNISLALPKLVFFNLQGCNLSESNFVLPLDCLFTFTFLDLSGNNFVRSSGLWPSSTEGKLLFDPVISFMGQTNEGSSVDSSQKAESSEHPPKVDKSSGESESPQKLSTVEAKEGVKTETLQHSSTEQMADKEETEVVKEETDDKHVATVEETETVVAEPEKSESESSSLPVEPFEPTVKNDGPSEYVGSQDDNKISVVGPSVNPETMQGKSRAVEVDQVEEGHTVLPREAHDVDVDEQKTQVEQKDGHMTQAGEIVETVAMVEAESPTDSQPGGFPLC